MSKIQIAVIGASGRMGQELAAAISQNKSAVASVGVVRKGKAIGFSSSASKLDKAVSAKADVVIDFSTLENFEKVLKFCADEKIPLITGTTGLGEKEKKALKKYSSQVAILWSPNMSLGVAALKEALKSFANLEGFDFQIEELHHNKKKDNPSGTALFLQDELVKQTKKKVPAPIGIRGGGIFGVHKVWAMSDSEVLCFEHQALNRKVFAEGALKAALWLANKKPGLYELKDVITK